VNERTAQTIVVVVGVGLFAYTGIRHLLADQSKLKAGGTYRQLWAIAALTLLLTLLADLMPQIAGPFAILVGLAYVSAGKGVGDLLDRVGKQTAKPASSQPASGKRFA
jgi:hypothetical protein